MAAAVWAGSPKDYKYKMTGVKIGPKFYRNVCGGCLPGPIWRDTMRAALKGLPAPGFQQPPADVLFGEGEPIPDVRGVPVDQAVAALQQAGFETQVSPDLVFSRQPAGTVAFTSPGAGSRSPKGSKVTVFISRGGQIGFTPTPTPPPGGGITPRPRKCRPRDFPICRPRE
jgi:PASTA domain